MSISNSTPLFGRHQGFGERSAFSSLQSRMSPVMDSPLSYPSKEHNLQTFRSLFTGSTPLTNHNIEKAKIFNWQQSMLKSLGKHSLKTSQKKGQDDSMIDMDCSTFDNHSTEKRGIKIDENVSNEEDQQLMGSSQEVAKKINYAENKDYDKDDGDLSLSVDGDYDDDVDDMLSTDEDLILMGDDVSKKTKTSTDLARKIDVNIAGQQVTKRIKDPTGKMHDPNFQTLEDGSELKSIQSQVTLPANDDVFPEKNISNKIQETTLSDKTAILKEAKGTQIDPKADKW